MSVTQTTLPAGIVLTSGRYADVLAGGAGADTLNAGQGPDRLTGGEGADSFVFKALPWNGGEITDFQVGVDRIDVSALFTDGYHGSDPVADGYLRFEANGAGGTKVMLDVDGASSVHPWAYLIATLDGISPTGLTAGNVLGWGRPVDPTAGVVLTSSHYADVLTGGAGADTLMAGQGADRLTGGDGADSFVVKAMPYNGVEITDFHAGLDRLDISQLYTNGYTGADPVADGYVRFISDGVGNTKVMLDTDGAGTAQPYSKLVAILDGVNPDTLTAANVFGTVAATVGKDLVSVGYGQALAGGAGADTLHAAQGPDVLSGGGGADHFVFGALPWNGGHVTDFTPGSDVLDLRPLFQASSYSGTDPIADHWLQFRADGSGDTQVYFDSDGPGGSEWPTLITTLDHVSPAQLSNADFLFH